MSIAVLKGRSAMGRERREGWWRQGESRAADHRGIDASDAHEPAAGADAKFLGWQSFSSGELFPLYAITLSDHPSFQSTVSDVTLRRLHLRIPRTPSPYPEIAPSPWHTLGVELDHPRTAREAMAMAGLDFAVVKNRVELNTGLLEETYATERTDTGEVLGIVGSGYEPVQNRDAFAFCDALVEAREAVYETAGVFGNGECTWILAMLPGYIKVRGNDLVKKYLLLTNSHDGSVPVRGRVTPVRVVCNNTLTSALQGAGEVHIHHTRSAAKRLEQAAALLELSHSAFSRLDVVFNGMAARKITDEQLREYVRALVPDNEEAESCAGAEAVRNDVLELHDSGRGAGLSRGTLWGAFNGVTEYTDHMMIRGDPTTRLKSIWFGRAEQLKLKAFRLAERMMVA